MNEKFVLYQDPYCPFCRRVTDYLESNNLDVPIRDITRDGGAYRDLVKGGGRGTVPCLQITSENGDAKWMYESLDIIAFLEEELDVSS